MQKERFERILEESRPWIRNIAVGKNLPEPDDFAQDVCVKAVRSRHAFKGKTDAEARAWIGSICHNLVKDMYRKIRRRPENVSLNSTNYVSSAPDDEAEHDFVRCDDKQFYDNAMTSLEPTMREILSRRLDGSPWSEIASFTGVDAESAKQMYEDAIELCKHMLEGDGF
jgi:RNA polymerase sigma factor (sigma-70 family)